MSRATPRPATIATTDTPVLPRPRVMMANTAAADAPELMPMMSGLARGLRSIVWKVTPPRPKHSPTRTARTARGSRSLPTVNDAPGTG